MPETEVIVVGDANVDIIVQYPRFLDEDRTRVVWPNPEVQGGGTSSNTAAALAKLGVACAMVGTVGDDSNGRFVRDDLAGCGVDVDGLVVDPSLNTVGVFAFVDERGERYLWGWPRERQSFKVIDEERVDFDRIRSSAWVHSSGMSLVYDTSARSTIARIFREAHEAGVPTSLDLNLRVDDGVLDPDFASALDAIMGDVTYLLGSGPEEFAYLGEGTWEENAAALARDGRTVVARDGAKGSIALRDGERFEAEAYRVEVEDTIGAGDVYNAGFIAALLAGKGLEEALRMGNAVSGYTVARKGPRNTPSADELSIFMRQYEL